MPESRKRAKKGGRSQADDLEIKSWTDGIPMSPSWWAPTFVSLLVVGLVWMVVMYMTGGRYPIPGIGNWNLAIGLGFMMSGFLMTLRWR
ncbi:MAG: cell division protein CrgA [Actinomycetaceae bacterium]|nr:cell division protein CrgA [Actinomycetaceae bacterium]